MRGALTDGLGELDSAFTAGPRDACAVARREAEAGRRLIVALGGDGTISEVANGILDAGAGARTELGIIPRGTGGDFRRTLELPHDVAEAARRIRDGQARPLDAGRVQFRGHSPERRRSATSSTSPRSGSPARSPPGPTPRPSGSAGGWRSSAATLRALVSYDNTDVWLTIGDRAARAAPGADGRRRQRTVLRRRDEICPEARIDDGALDLVTVGDFSKGEVLTNIGRLYEGTHLELDAVQSARVTRIAVEPVEADARIPIELDGETPGHLPAVFEIVPAALRVRI